MPASAPRGEIIDRLAFDHTQRLGGPLAKFAYPILSEIGRRANNATACADFVCSGDHLCALTKAGFVVEPRTFAVPEIIGACVLVWEYQCHYTLLVPEYPNLVIVPQAQRKRSSGTSRSTD